MPLEDIAVSVYDPRLDNSPTPNVQALLNEIATHLVALLEDGEGSSIDLRGLPLMPGEREALRNALGRGEISARVETLGEAEIHETAFPGVWWSQHRDESGDTVAELIEICLQPAMLTSHPADVGNGLERLHRLIDSDTTTV
ncbi:MAG: hydrogenase expression/formation C-terminal domain-containing protein [Acidihalobacter sp.]|uniref:hydrogenase expression/formation C-terminal domain-containing protein n=1 Tax=Acidihalobacter sp. TaxID=1872108 RepID=UPI00307CE814